MKALIAFLLSMTLSVPTQGLNQQGVAFEHENVAIECVEEGDSGASSTIAANAANIPSSYDSYMEAYFRGLTTNYAVNQYNSCGYVALGMLLSYYDSYLCDNIIPNDYDIVSTGEERNMVARNNSPGIKKEIINSSSAKNYYENIIKKSDNFLGHLIKMAKENYNLFNFSENNSAGNTNLGDRVNILGFYLNGRLGIPSNNIRFRPDGEKNKIYDIKLFIKQNIDAGIPVLIGARKSSEANEGHAMICYAYTTQYDKNDPLKEDDVIDDMTLYVHSGLFDGKGTYISLEETNYDVLTSAMAIEFNYANHSCSNNYEVGTGDNKKTYCYCSNEIMTYTSEWTHFNEPENFDGNLVVPNWVTGINTRLFYNNQDIISLTYEANSSLNSIGAEAFKGCSNLMYVEIPKSVTTIGAWAFGNTVNLESVFFEQGSNLQTICSSAFRESSLMFITLPKSIEAIESYAFALTPRLTSIALPSSVTSIGVSAFGCGDLLGNTNLTIYTDRTDIPSSGDVWQQNWNAIVDYTQAVTPGSDGYAKNSVFFGCTLSSDKSYVKSVTRTSNNLLHPNASNIYNSPSREGYGFGGWYSNSSYSGTEYTTAEIAVKTSGTYYIKWIPNLLQYNLLSDGTYEVEMIASLIGGDLEIPSEYNGKPVTKIAENGFRECVNLISVSFPYTVTTIGANAFRDCTSLESLEMPFVQVIEDYAFYGCQNLTATNFYLYAEEVGAFAFGCTDIRGLIVTTSVEYVGLFAFKDCENLQFVNLKRTSESGVTWIESTAFEGCIELFVIDTPDVDSYYDYYAQFEGNDWLTLRLVCLELI
ncbi:MAG: leucine-rich repeat domain-containing protein [Clostridiales bacterium]|nr:leucine-rich repeat domain-containing protein [Clostridiales bacterium]